MCRTIRLQMLLHLFEYFPLHGIHKQLNRVFENARHQALIKEDKEVFKKCSQKLKDQKEMSQQKATNQ